MPRITSEVLIPGVLTLIVVVSLVSLAQPTAAIDTVVDAPDEVTKHDPIELTVVATSTAEESADVESYTIVLTPDGEDESVRITFDRDGDVLSVDPPRGTVGNGDIRVNRLRRDLSIEVETTTNDTGYGYGYGYGYGDGETTATFDVVLPSSAFKHGDYTVAASVNTAEETGVGASTEERVSVLVPSGQDPPNDDEPPRGDQQPNDEIPPEGEDRDERPNRGVVGMVDWVFGDSGGSVLTRVWFAVRIFVFGGL